MGTRGVITEDSVILGVAVVGLDLGVTRGGLGAEGLIPGGLVLGLITSTFSELGGVPQTGGGARGWGGGTGIFLPHNCLTFPWVPKVTGCWSSCPTKSVCNLNHSLSSAVIILTLGFFFPISQIKLLRCTIGQG